MAENRWEYVESARRYRDTDSGRFVSASEMRELRDGFVDKQSAAITDLAKRLDGGDLTAAQWAAQMRERVKLVWTTQYAFGRGGKNAMTEADTKALSSLVREQFGYLDGFVSDVGKGELSAPMIAARAQLYVAAATSGYEQGRATAHSALKLPAHPADGSTQCMARCRCTWEIEETDDAWRCTWHLGDADHCPDCERRAGEWAPLVVSKKAA